MAFDAAPAVQAPMPGAAASAKPAARQGDASDPFGALLAMLDGAETESPQAAPRKPSADVPADNADRPAPADAGKDAPTAEADAPSDAAASDPGALMAAMMIPAAVTSTPIASAPAAETTPPTAAVAVVPALDPQTPPVAADATPIPAAADDRVPPLAKAAEAGAVDPGLQLAEAAPPPRPMAESSLVAPAPSPTAQPESAVAPAPQQTAQPGLAANDKLADAARADPTGTGAVGAARADAQGETGQQHDTADRQPSDAEASQKAQIDRPGAPAVEPQTFAAAAPETPAPAIGAAPPAAPPPVIAAQVAAMPVRGMPETVAHLAAQMIQRLDGRTTRFDLTLNPQSLGRVDVRIEIGLKGALRARMAFDDAATAQEMSGRHTELRAALQSAGFDVPEGALSFDVASGGGGAFADRQDADRAAAPVFQNFADTAEQDPVAAVKNYFSAAGSSGVDIRV